MSFVPQVVTLKETSEESSVEVNRSKFFYLLFSFFFQSRDKRLRLFFFVRGEPVLALKRSSLRGNVLLSTALFVSKEVLIESSCETGTFISPSLARNSISTICKVPGTSLSPGRLKWALVAQRTELRAQSERPSSEWCERLCPALYTVKKSPVGNKGQISLVWTQEKKANEVFGCDFCLAGDLKVKLKLKLKLSCYGQDVMFPAQNEHGFPRMHCEKGLK